ncbi:MAG: radical SAM family heme chaperone HemW, partial [Oscillospiraceae bacterium]|nr:radical SAM family heme chaperone HemW [Oscillospiraceae bacterium]
IYIHIPFCKAKCDYCDFYSLPDREDVMDNYQKALIAHIKETAPLAKGWQVDTVYIGGGTPSYFGGKRISAVLGEVKRRFDVMRDAEITCEANPESADLPFLRAIRHAGVNRLSLGMQSSCNAELRSVHRLHDFAQVEQAVRDARKAKIKNLSLDLIYGLPGQSMESWPKRLEAALELHPEHLSGYGLKVEPGTALDGRVMRGEVLPDDDLQADMYLWMVDRLEKAGYAQYEISNFAKAGFQSRHNLKYWMGKPYVGFGPGAHSDFGGRRYSFARDLDQYIIGILEGGRVIDDDQLVPHRERGGEYLMLRLRTTRGIEEWEYRREFSMNFDPLEQKLEEYERQGWAARKERRWHLTAKGFLLSNQLIGDLLIAQEAGTLQTTLPRLRAEGLLKREAPDERKQRDGT